MNTPKDPESTFCPDPPFSLARAMPDSKSPSIRAHEQRKHFTVILLFWTWQIGLTMRRPSLWPVATRFLFRHRSKPDLYRRFQRPLPLADTTAAVPRTTRRTVHDPSAEALYPFLRNCAARAHLPAPQERPPASGVSVPDSFPVRTLRRPVRQPCRVRVLL